MKTVVTIDGRLGRNPESSQNVGDRKPPKVTFPMFRMEDYEADFNGNRKPRFGVVPIQVTVWDQNAEACKSQNIQEGQRVIVGGTLDDETNQLEGLTLTIHHR